MKRKLMMCLLVFSLLISGCSSESDTTGGEVSETTEETAVTETNEVTSEDGTSVEEVISDMEVVDKEANFQKQVLDSPIFDVNVKGVEVYDEYVGDKYTDTASDGNVYVVVYLQVLNDSREYTGYFDYSYLASKLDGEVVETTFMINDPKGYKTMFTHLPTREKTEGFLVYEVPSDWKTIDIEYKGWKNMDAKGWQESFDTDLVFQVSSDDLQDVIEFGMEYFAPYQGEEK